MAARGACPTAAPGTRFDVQRHLSAAELVPVAFGRAIDAPHPMSFAFSDTLTHANLLLRQGRLLFEGGRRVTGSTDNDLR